MVAFCSARPCLSSRLSVALFLPLPFRCLLLPLPSSSRSVLSVILCVCPLRDYRCEWATQRSSDPSPLLCSHSPLCLLSALPSTRSFPSCAMLGLPWSTTARCILARLPPVFPSLVRFSFERSGSSPVHCACIGHRTFDHAESIRLPHTEHAPLRVLSTGRAHLEGYRAFTVLIRS